MLPHRFIATTSLHAYAVEFPHKVVMYQNYHQLFNSSIICNIEYNIIYRHIGKQIKFFVVPSVLELVRDAGKFSVAFVCPNHAMQSVTKSGFLHHSVSADEWWICLRAI